MLFSKWQAKIQVGADEITLHGQDSPLSGW